MDQFRSDSDRLFVQASAPSSGTHEPCVLSGSDDPTSPLAAYEVHSELIRLLDRDADTERGAVPSGLVDRVFAASSVRLGARDEASVSTSRDPRPALRLVADRTRRDGLERLGASRRFGNVSGRIGSALAMAATIAIALVVGIPATQVALRSQDGGMRTATATFDAAPFAATLGRSGGVEPVLVSLLQGGYVTQVGNVPHVGQDSAGGMSTSAWPGLRAVPISADSSTSELLSIIEARDVQVDDLADDLARMRRDVNDRS